MSTLSQEIGTGAGNILTPIIGGQTTTTTTTSPAPTSSTIMIVTIVVVVIVIGAIGYFMFKTKTATT